MRQLYIVLPAAELHNHYRNDGDTLADLFRILCGGINQSLFMDGLGTKAFGIYARTAPSPGSKPSSLWIRYTVDFENRLSPKHTCFLSQHCTRIALSSFWLDAAPSLRHKPVSLAAGESRTGAIQIMH